MNAQKQGPHKRDGEAAGKKGSLDNVSNIPAGNENARGHSKKDVPM